MPSHFWLRLAVQLAASGFRASKEGGSSMGIDTVPMIAFLGTVSKWLRAVEEAQTDHARFLVDQLNVAGQLLAIDPEFKRIYLTQKRTCTEQDAEKALTCVHAFLGAVTEAGQPGRFRSGRQIHHRPSQEP